MKHLKAFSFLLIFAALAFFTGCSGKEDKYDLDYDIPADDSDVTDTDSDSTDDSDTTPSPDSDTSDDEPADDTDTTDGDTTPSPDSDIPDDEPADDTDTTDGDTTPGRDDDSGDNDDDSGEENPDKDTDTDTDTGSVDEDNDQDTDTDSEEPDIDEKEETAVFCTGLTKCYDYNKEITCPASHDHENLNYFGQDAQYSADKGYCLKQSFTTKTMNGDDVVKENITGLMWQRTLPLIYSGCSVKNNESYEGALCLYNEAEAYCDSLNYAGYSDWRLPTPEEFGTIINFGKINPAIDLETFPTLQSSISEFWTQTFYASSSSKIWYIDFSSGTTKFGTDAGKQVRCVRGDGIAKAVFTVKNEGADEEIIEDSTHYLLWTKKTKNENSDDDDASYTWVRALYFCQELNYGGKTGWRLPTINELASILDYSRDKPASEFPGLVNASFWSSTTYPSTNPNKAWKINSETGEVQTAGKTNKARVLCVQ